MGSRQSRAQTTNVQKKAQRSQMENQIMNRNRMENYEEENYEDNRQVRAQEQSIAKKYWWAIVLVVILLCILVYSLRMRNQPMGKLR